MADPIYAPGANPFDPGDDFPSTAAGVTLPPAVTAVEPDYTYAVGGDFKTRTVEALDGTEKRSAQGALRRKWKIAFDNLTPDDANTLWNHYLAQSGPLASFNLYDYVSEETFSVRYGARMNRQTFVFEAERIGVELVEVI